MPSDVRQSNEEKSGDFIVVHSHPFYFEKKTNAVEAAHEVVVVRPMQGSEVRDRCRTARLETSEVRETVEVIYETAKVIYDTAEVIYETAEVIYETFEDAFRLSPHAPRLPTRPGRECKN